MHFPLMPNRHFLVEFWKCQKAVSILPHEAKWKYMILHWQIRTGSDWWFLKMSPIRTVSDSILSDQDWTWTEKFHSPLISARDHFGSKWRLTRPYRLQPVQVLKAHSPKSASENFHTTHGCQKKPFCPKHTWSVMRQRHKTPGLGSSFVIEIQAHARTGGPNLFLTMYPFSIPTN